MVLPIALPPDKFYLLKFVFPAITMDFVQSNYLYLSSRGSVDYPCSYVFFYDKSGINILSAGGLCNVLRDMGYLEEYKFSKIENYRKDMELEELYKSVALLMLNCYLPDDEREKFIRRGLALPLTERVTYFRDFDSEYFVESVLKIITTMNSIEGMGHDKRKYMESLLVLKSRFKAEEFLKLDTSLGTSEDLKYILLLMWR